MEDARWLRMFPLAMYFTHDSIYIYIYIYICVSVLLYQFVVGSPTTAVSTSPFYKSPCLNCE